MNRKMLKLMGVAAVAVAVVGTGLTFSLSSQATAEAAVSVPPIGTICVKPASMVHTFNPAGTIGGPVATTGGTISAQVGQRITTSDGRTGFNFAVVSFISNGFVQGLGNLSITLDTSRRPSASTFISNSPQAKQLTDPEGNTQRINFFINVDIDGQKLRSQGQVTLLSTSVQDFPPPPGTVYELASAVTLVDSTGKAAFVLPAGFAARIN
ncbi:MAG TPA: hypothetical protein VLE27_07805 [Thermoanaerobaculia bacterium]|nr:hypothetical protein [Thermoanaerobaculia bacterium]